MDVHLTQWIVFIVPFVIAIGTTHCNESIVTTVLKNNTLSVLVVPFQISSSGVNVDAEHAEYVRFRNKAHIESVDTDYHRHMFYFYETNSATIYSLNYFTWDTQFKDMTLSAIHQGVSKANVKLAVDWISNNIYWTDPLFKWIAVKSLAKNETFYKILIKDGLGYPLGIAVDPVHHYLFWGDGGPNPRIERSRLDGRERKTILSQGMRFPIAIDVDQILQEIVWVDVYRATIETANFDGTGRRIIRRMTHAAFFDVAVFQGVIFVVDRVAGQVHIVNRNTGEGAGTSMRTAYSLLAAISIFATNVQPSQINYCENSLCSDICVNDPRGPVCLCKEGYILDTDALHCKEDTGLLHRALVWSNTTHICYVDARAIKKYSFSENQTCFISSGTSINYLDIDCHTREVIYADGSGIFKVNIDVSPTVPERITSATENVTGVAVDWRDKNIYWCQGTTMGKIMMNSQQDVFSLITTNLQSPRTLKILPIQDVYFIHKASIKVCGLDGLDLSTLSSSLMSPQNILVYKNHLVTFDNFDTSVKSFNKQTPSTMLSSFTLDSLTDFGILDSTTQPDQHGPCDLLNGGCEQICIPAGRDRFCQCEYGFHLDDNKQTCSTVPLLDNFLLVADWTHKKVYQVSLVDNRVSALDSGMIKEPNGVACNPLTRELIWGDTSMNLVQRVTVNGTGYKVLANIGGIGSHPDRFAIDYTNGDIYYTAVATESNGFIGIGVLSPHGYNTRFVSFGKQPKAIQLDIAEGLMFWTDHGISPAAVLQARLNGSNIQTLGVQVDLPTGIAIDRTAKILYITDGKTNKINRCTYGGICSVYYTDPGAWLKDIKLDGDYLYYTAWNKVFITKIHKTNSLDRTQLATNAELGILDAFCVYNTSSGPTTSSTYTTISTVTLGPTPSFTTSTAIRTTLSLITSPKSTATTSSVTILIGAGSGLSGFILIVVMVVCVYCRLRSKRSTNRPTYVTNTPLEMSVVNQDPASREHRGIQQQHQQRYNTYASIENESDSSTYDIIENPYTVLASRITSYEQPIMASELTEHDRESLLQAPPVVHKPPVQSDYLTPTYI